MANSIDVEDVIGSFELEEDNNKDVCISAVTSFGHHIEVPDTRSGISGEYVLVRAEDGWDDVESTWSEDE